MEDKDKIRTIEKLHEEYVKNIVADYESRLACKEKEIKEAEMRGFERAFMLCFSKIIDMQN